MKKRLLVLGILVAAGIIAFLAYHFGNKRDDGAIALSGNVEVTEVNIGFKSSGRIVELLADEGERIHKGDRLAVLDRAELESQVAQSRAYLDETTVRLQELRAGSRPQEIEQAKSQVGYAEAEFSKASKDYERDEILFKNGAISAQHMDATKKTYDVFAARHRQAVESFSLVKEGPRREHIIAAEKRMRQAEAALRSSEERLKDMTIYTPLSGVILRRNIELGETVAPGIPVYTIGDIGNPWIKVYIKEDKLGLVKLGQKANITTDTYPGKVYEGTVTYISSEAEFTPKNIQTQEERVKLVFGVKISLKNLNDELKPSMPADVRISLR